MQPSPRSFDRRQALFTLGASGASLVIGAGSAPAAVIQSCVSTPKPAVTAAGVVNAASFATGLTPGSWISIFGSTLGLYARTLQASDIVNNIMPTSMGGVTVTINGKPAFLHYVNTGQVNVLSPNDTASGPVEVVVTNASGTSEAVMVQMNQIMPAFFAGNGYAAAVSAAGNIVTGVAVKPGDILAIYGTGFGPTQQAVTPGLVFSGSYPTANVVTMRIGGQAAEVLYSGLTATGLYQINVRVPSLASGDHQAVATVGGSATSPATGAAIKVQA